MLLKEGSIWTLLGPLISTKFLGIQNPYNFVSERCLLSKDLLLSYLLRCRASRLWVFSFLLLQVNQDWLFHFYVCLIFNVSYGRFSYLFIIQCNGGDRVSYCHLLHWNQESNIVTFVVMRKLFFLQFVLGETIVLQSFWARSAPLYDCLCDHPLEEKLHADFPFTLGERPLCCGILISRKERCKTVQSQPR